MFPLFTLMALAQLTAERRYRAVYVDSQGRTYTVAKPVLQARRAGKWKGRNQLIERVKFVIPRGWSHERREGREAMLVAPQHHTGWAPVITVTVMDGPGQPTELYNDLLQRGQERPKFKLLGGGVVTRESGQPAAAIRYTFEEREVSILEEEILFPIDDGHVVWMRSLCPEAIYREFADTITQTFAGLRVVNRQDVKPSIRPQFG